MKKNKTMKKILLLVLTISSLTITAQTHVRPTATGNGTGANWANATTLENAVATAVSNQVIWVQAGTYNLTATLVVPQGVKIYGGFAGTETAIRQRNSATGPTILDANNNFGAVTLENNAVMSGFIIENGKAKTPIRANGGGVLMRAGSRLESSKVLNNMAANYGGGIFVEADAVIVNSVIAYNSAGINGFAVSGDNVTFLSNTVVGNRLLEDCIMPPTLALTSAPATANQAMGFRQPITEIVYTFGGSATAVTVVWSWRGTASSTTPPDGITVSSLTESPIRISGTLPDHFAHDTVRFFIATVATRICPASDTLRGAILQTSYCNTNTPGWGPFGLGTITYGNTTNTDIYLGSTKVYRVGTPPPIAHGLGAQIWSAHVFASNCADKTTFSAINNVEFNADCRRSHEERAELTTGHFFSWCAVIRFDWQMCPAPWRVPTVQDFIHLHWILTGQTPFTVGGIPMASNPYLGYPVGTLAEPQIGGAWGGASFTGTVTMLEPLRSVYWSTTRATDLTARFLYLSESHVNLGLHLNKGIGHVVRCVRDVP